MKTTPFVILSLLGNVLALSPVPDKGTDPCKGTHTGVSCFTNSEISEVAGHFGKTLINGGPCFKATTGALAGKEICFVRVDVDGNTVSAGYEVCHDPVVCKLGGAGGDDADEDVNVEVDDGDEVEGGNKVDDGDNVDSDEVGDAVDGGGAEPPANTQAVKSSPPSPAPTGCNLRPLTSKEIEEIVSKHNALRAQASKGDSWTDPETGVTNVTLSAATSTIQDLVWDEDLATGALTWAKTCPFMTHDTDADRWANSNKEGAVGQNGGWYMSSNYNPNYPVANYVQRWYDEIRFMSDAEIGSFPRAHHLGAIGHYTQVVWADTQKVGCARAEWPNGMYYEVLMCNYFPRGNMLGKSVYPIKTKK